MTKSLVNSEIFSCSWSALSGSDVVDARPGSPAHAWHHLPRTPVGGHAGPLLYRDPEEIEKEEQAAAEKAVTKEEFQGEWTAPAPEFTAAQPEVADWSEGVQVPSVPIQQFPTGTYQDPRASSWWFRIALLNLTYL